MAIPPPWQKVWICPTSDGHLQATGFDARGHRIGNSEYARENESFGLTTLRNRQSGVKHDVEIKDRRIAKILKECHDLPGYALFEYLDEQGNIRTIGSGDVNGYLRAITEPVQDPDLYPDD